MSARTHFEHIRSERAQFAFHRCCCDNVIKKKLLRDTLKILTIKFLLEAAVCVMMLIKLPALNIVQLLTCCY